MGLGPVLKPPSQGKAGIHQTKESPFEQPIFYSKLSLGARYLLGQGQGQGQGTRHTF